MPNAAKLGAPIMTEPGWGMTCDAQLPGEVVGVSELTAMKVGGPDAIHLTVCASCNRTDRWQKLTDRHYARGGLCPGPVSEVLYRRDREELRVLPMADMLAAERCRDVHGDTYTAPWCQSCRGWARHIVDLYEQNGGWWRE